MRQEKIAGVETVPLTQYDLHTIVTALEFRADMWDSEISGTSDADDSNRDKRLAERLKKIQSK